MNGLFNLRTYLIGISLGISLISYSNTTVEAGYNDISIALLRPFATLARSFGISLILVSMISGPLFSIRRSISHLNNSFLIFAVCVCFSLRTIIGPLIRGTWSYSMFLELFVWVIFYFFLCYLRHQFSIDFIASIKCIKSSLLAFVIFFTWLNVFLYFTFPQVLISPGRRLSGIFAHPNFAGLAFSIFTIIILFSLIYNCRFNAYKVFSFHFLFDFSSLIFSFYFMFLTGSRTALLSFLIALMFIPYKPKGTFSILLILSFLLLFYFLLFDPSLSFSDSTGASNRSFSTADTRSDAWISLLQTGLSNIFTGVDAPGYSENSYLYLLAQGGFLGFLTIIYPFISFVILQLQPINKNYISNKFLGVSPLIILFFSAFFEGSLAKDLLSFPIFFLMLYFSIYDYSRIYNSKLLLQASH